MALLAGWPTTQFKINANVVLCVLDLFVDTSSISTFKSHIRFKVIYLSFYSAGLLNEMNFEWKIIHVGHVGPFL